jgi:anti-sigma regulatory factor (Ser/Thr protein kinase)
VDTQTYRAGAWGARGGRLFARPAASTIDIELDSGPEAAAWARSALLALEPRIDPRVMEDVRLLVSELVTNSVRHAGVPDAAIVRICARLAEGTLRLEVQDPGTAGAVAQRMPDHDRGGGFGLNIVDALATRWGVERESATLVWAEFWCLGSAVQEPHRRAARSAMYG